MKTNTILVGVLFVLSHSRSAFALTVHRYLAWVEGDVQSGYQIYGRTVSTKLQEWEASPPDPSDADSYLEYLSILDSSGKLDSEKKIKKYLEDRPTDKRALFILAAHYLRRNRTEIAKYFFKSLEGDKDFTWKSLIYNNQGMLALKDRDRDQAIALFQKAIESEPLIAAPLVNLGALYLHSKSFQDSERLFRKALTTDEDFEDAALGLGASLEGQAKFEEAHDVYAKFIIGHSNAISTLYNDSLILGNRLNRKGEAQAQMQLYMQRGGKETARAQEIIQGWR